MELRNLIIAPAKLRQKPVSVPEWEGTDGLLFMRELSEADFLQVQQDQLDRNPQRRARLAVMILVDADGNPVLSAADVEPLSRQPAGPLARLYAEWNGWMDADVKAQKKSSKTPTKKRSGTSPSNSGS